MLSSIAAYQSRVPGAELEFGDYVGIAEGIALVGTWRWALSRGVPRNGMRHKLAIYALGAASISVVIDLILTLILHFHQNPDDSFAGKAYLLLFPLSALAALIGLVSGLIARGTPRVAAVIWSLLMLASDAVTMYLIAR